MKRVINPFHLSGYFGPETFCDRAGETERVITNIENGVTTMLFSLRRMGKTGLIHHVFNTLKDRKRTFCLYLDIYGTSSLLDFTNQIASASFQAFPQDHGIGKKFLNVVKNLRPVISFDPITQQPQMSFDLERKEQQLQSLSAILDFLDRQSAQIILAIDEFQQILSYPEKNVEAILRTEIQKLQNIHFIFSGSSQHLLREMFNNSKRPFFASASSMKLGSLDKSVYMAFIEKQFIVNRRIIHKDALELIVDWSKLHTYYTQYVCNRIFSAGYVNIREEDVDKVCSQILQEEEPVFFQYRKLLTPIQWNLLKAIAIEDKVYQPTSKHFLNNHPVGTAANVQRALESLTNKEMVYADQDNSGNFYRVYNCFLARWLQYRK